METAMFAHAMRRLVRAVGRGGGVLNVSFSLGFLSLLLVPYTPALAATLTLTWTDASTNEDGFKIERATGTAGAYGQLAAVGAETTGYVDGTVSPGTTYCYRVRAYNSAGDSAYSNAACTAPVSATLYTVTVGKAGSGSGTVASSPSGVDCGSTCSASIASGTSLALSATPTSGSTFTGWSGACSGTGSCTLVVDANKSLTATFATSTPTTYTLTLSKSGTGSGTVTSAPSGIACGSTCSASYSSGTSVTLTAAPAPGATFTGWSGACSGTSATCTVSMTAARSVTATFTAQTYTLTVSKGGTGAGLVASNPAGINCGTTCSASFGSGTGVTLQAMPEAGSTFTGWSGACTGTDACTLTMNQVRSVTATFALQSFSLSLSKSGTGSGSVTSSPSGIACGSDCAESYSYNTSVTLAATAATGSAFTGWSGACTGTAATCTVTMDAAKSVTATFDTTTTTTSTQTTYTLTVKKDGNAKGTVASDPSGIACGRDCSEGYAAGTRVTLTATPATGATFTGWSGACAGTGTCTVTLNQSTSVTASFKKLRR
jgi:uncharacterized repeat protein (TIGR02543 family)